jgi:RNA-splicing ligase RtcB
MIATITTTTTTTTTAAAPLPSLQMATVSHTSARTRITVASNRNQSLKAPLVIPSGSSLVPKDQGSCTRLVKQHAQTKLRLKKPHRIFVAGTGKELEHAGDWESQLKDDIVLLISLGEDYVGATNPSGASDSVHNTHATISSLASKAYIDPLSLTQLRTTARTLPGIIHAVAQPDLHPGTKFPIGAVFVSEGWIHPPLIGGDIGCGMAWYRTKLSPSQVDGDKGKRIAEKLRGVEGPWRTQSDRRAWLDESDGVERSAGEEWDTALGTIGAGNHFAELQIVEHVSPSTPLLTESSVILLVHSGSRGYGGDILKRYTTSTTTSLPCTSPLAVSYLRDHDRACLWASRNRDLIALRFLSCLEPGEAHWAIGNPASGSPIAIPADTIAASLRAIHARKVVDITHNNLQLVPWPPANPTTQVFLHRKGAAPITPFHSHTSAAATALLPLLPLPGSRGTPTLILRPVATAANGQGFANALSLAHGAGRALSRAKAATTVASKYAGRAEDLLRGDYRAISAGGNKDAPSAAAAGDGAAAKEGQARALYGGTWVVCEDKALVWEEAPEAYKDVWAVGDDLVSGGVAEVLGWCRGVVSYKVRKEGR